MFLVLLRSLDATGSCSELTDLGISSIAAHCPMLSSLCFSSLGNVRKLWIECANIGFLLCSFWHEVHLTCENCKTRQLLLSLSWVLPGHCACAFNIDLGFVVEGDRNTFHQHRVIGFLWLPGRDRWRLLFVQFYFKTVVICFLLFSGQQRIFDVGSIVLTPSDNNLCVLVSRPYSPRT